MALNFDCSALYQLQKTRLSLNNWLTWCFTKLLRQYWSVFAEARRARYTVGKMPISRRFCSDDSGLLPRRKFETRLETSSERRVTNWNRATIYIDRCEIRCVVGSSNTTAAWNFQASHFRFLPRPAAARYSPLLTVLRRRLPASDYWRF